MLGHPAFYPRFGFPPAGPYGIACEYEASEEAFLVRELHPGALARCRGTVHYRPEFREVGGAGPGAVRPTRT